MSEALKSLERGFKRVLSHGLRFLLRSRPVLPPDPESVRNILVIRQHNQLGDMLCVVPLLRALRSLYSGSRVSLLASPANLDVMLHNRYLDEVIPFEKKKFLGAGGPHPGKLLAFLRALRSRRFDMAIVPATVSISSTSDLLAYASRAPIRVGAAGLGEAGNPYGFLFNLPRRLDWRGDPHRHQTLRNYDIVGSFVPEPTDLRHELTLTEEESERGREHAKGIGRGFERIVAFHPGAGKVPNRWPADRFAELANALGREFQAMVLVTAGPMDDEPVREMERGLTVPYYLLRNEYIRRVAAILKFVSLLVSNDTGIMHVAGGVGSAVLSIFGPTDPLQWAPLGEKNRSIVGAAGDITTLSVEDVLRMAREMLRS
jgi:heptosyltransferase-1